MKTKLKNLAALAARQARSVEARAMVAAVAVTGAVAAHADGGVTVDTSQIAAAIVTIGTVGGAAFGAYVAVKVFKWIRGGL